MLANETRLEALRRADEAARQRCGTPWPDAGARQERAHHYRLRAEEQRTLAEDSMLPETRRILLSLADSYDHMAAMLDNMPELPD